MSCDSFFWRVTASPPIPPAARPAAPTTPRATAAVLETLHDELVVALSPGRVVSTLGKLEVVTVAGDEPGDVARTRSGPFDSRAGTVTIDEVFGSTFTIVDHVFEPAAFASIVCSPGSTGSGAPHASGGMATPSRVTEGFDAFAGVETVTESRASKGSRAAAAAAATCSRGC